MGSTTLRFRGCTAMVAAAGLCNLLQPGAVSAQAAAASDSGPPPSAQRDAPAIEEVVVTGIRKSLENATNAKRDSVTFGDAIYAEDIGKLPATNLAETLNRIPGVNISRDLNGEGLQVSIRGLSPSFSKVLLNGAQVAVASDGGTNGGAANREVDLDLFPSELFTRLSVQKTPVASQLEGGIAGTVNLQNARPFDTPGEHLTAIGQGQYTDSNGQVSPRGALIGSKTWDKFGILLGVSGVRTKTRVDGFETVGWTDPNISCTGCGQGLDTGNGFSFASTVPAKTGFGLTPGAPVNLAAISGLPLPTLSAALIPRLARNTLIYGTRSRWSTLLSAEFRPTDTLQFELAAMYARSDRDYQRDNMTWYVRNSGPIATGGMVPIGLTVDQNNVVTSGTFANSVFFLDQDLFKQKTNFWNLNPKMHWEPSDTVRLDATINYGHSAFTREQPTWIVQTPYNSGLAVFYKDDGGLQPSITSNVNLADPNLGWNWYRATVALIKRDTLTKGAHTDLTLGDEKDNFKVGVAYDEAFRAIHSFDNSAAYQASICGSTCNGLTGTIPTSQIPNFLMPLNITNFGHLSSSSFGYTNFVMLNIPALEQATNYTYYLNRGNEIAGAVTGGAVGTIDEKTAGVYVEGNTVTQILERNLHLNFGVRYFHTAQSVESLITVGKSLVPQTLTHGYEDILPSFNVAWDVRDNLKLRLAGSRSMTRADAGSLLPGTGFGDPSAQVATAGNPDLRPYTSNNIDFGGEFYTGGSGYVGLDLFRKDIDGFTETQQTTVPFTSLGLDFNTLPSYQQVAIQQRGGPDVATVTLTRPVNLDNLQIKGAELTWVQPLDFLLRGLGFSANGTRLTQSSRSGLFATGISPYSANVQGYYENYGLSVSVNYVWNDKSVALNPPQNNINLPLIAQARGQLDLSMGYVLPFMQQVRVTLDAQNLDNAPLRTLFGYKNAPYSVYYPGRTLLVGVRAKF